MSKRGPNRAKAITSFIISKFCKIGKVISSPPPGNTISSKIRYFRQLRRLTQDEIALKAGISRSIIARYEQDRIKNLNPHILLQIAKSLKINPTKMPPSSNGDIKDFFDYFIKPSDFGSKLKVLGHS